MTAHNDRRKQTFADFQRRTKQIRERRKEAEREQRRYRAMREIREVCQNERSQ
jgi:hypothetical protein